MFMRKKFGWYIDINEKKIWNVLFLSIFYDMYE